MTDSSSDTATKTFSLTVNTAVSATQAVATTLLTQNKTATSFTPVTGANGTTPLTYSVSPALPTGLSLSTSTGAITGTPTVISSATTYTVTVTDSNGATATKTFSLTVNAAVSATQAVASTSLTQNKAATSFTPVTGANGTGTLSYSISPTLPTGLSLSTSTGAITGTPTATSSATTYTVTVTDANSATATNTFSLTVNAAVSATQAVATTTLTQNKVATSFTPVTGANGTGTLSYSVSPTLPTGLTLSTTTGAITGTATVTSSATTYTVTVTDANSATATKTFSLTVNAAVTATQAIPTKLLTQNYAVTSFTPVTGANGTGTLTYSVSPTLPTGLSFSTTTGAITGTATGSSSATTYTVTVTDTNSATATNTFSLTVNIAVSATQAVATNTLTLNLVATAYTPVTGSGGTTPLAYSVSPALPTGLSFSTSTGAITGTPTVISTATTYTVTVTDANSATATNTFSLTVGQAAQAITAFAPSTPVTYGVSPITLTATGGSSGNPVTFSVLSGPGSVSGTNNATLTVTGAGTIVVAANQAGNTSYLAAPQVTASIVVNKAALTVTVNAATSVYGVAFPTFTGTLTGVITGDGITASYSTSATPTSAVGGTYSITATLNDPNTKLANYTVTNTPAALTLTKATPLVSLTSGSNPVLLLNPVVLTATLTGATAPTGSVSFLDGATLLGTSTASNGIATLTVTTLAVGTHSISAAYGGDTNFNSATNATPISEVVDDFSLAISVSGGSGSITSVTALPGGTAVYSFSVSPVNASTFPATVTLSATGLPKGATYVFSPATLASGSGTQTVTLTIQIPQTLGAIQPLQIHGGTQMASSSHTSTARRFAPFALALLLLPFAGSLRRRLPSMLCALLLLALAAVGISGCGSGGSGYFGQGVTSYTITVTGTSGPLTHSTSVSLTVE